jgi:pimeloyl-ACP methyl ester carboxylesterase
LLFAAAFVAVLAVRPAAGAEAGGSAGACWFTVPQGQSALCGTVSVPERRDQPDGRRILLPFAVLRSTARTPAADPVIYVEGGPGATPFGFGEATEERVESWWETSAPLRRTRDFVLFDPRGVGRAQPDTGCPELQSLATGPDAGEPTPRARRESAEAKALSACVARLTRDGVALAGFSTPAAADDVAELARALDAPRVNLLAVSYGSRVALEVMRRHPDLVRAAVLDSVYPPDVDALESGAWLAARAYRRLFQDCAANRRCHAAFPVLEQRFLELVARLDRQPVDVTVGDPLVPRTVRMDGTALLTAGLDMMAEGELIGELPLLLDRASRGRLARLAERVPTPWIGDPETANGVAFSTECRETVNPADNARIAEDRRANPPYGLAMADDPSRRICALWPAGVQDPAERQPVHSAVPVLLMSGAYDPVTPPEWAERAAATLAHSRHMVFRATGHAVSTADPCAMEAAARLFETANPARVPACPIASQPPRFAAP